MHWNSDNSVPAAEKCWQAWQPPWGRKNNGEAAVRKALRKWHAQNPVLISRPDSEHLLPAICFPETSQDLHRRALRHSCLIMFIAACFALGFIATSIKLQEVYFLRAGAVFALVIGFYIIQYIFIFRHIDQLRTYSRFCAWCHLQPHTKILIPAIGFLMVGVGTIQYFLQGQIGSLFGFLEEYGLVFQKAGAQPWRYFIGPFFHSGLVHWIANFSLLIVGSGLFFALGKAKPLALIFFAGVYMPAFALAYMPHWIASDAFVGISGGLFAQFGWIAGVAIKNSKPFPRGFGWLVAYFGIFMTMTSSLMDPRASWFCHSLGLLLGFLAGILGIGAIRLADAPHLAAPKHEGI